MRGNHFKGHAFLSGLGPIPAYAGEPAAGLQSLTGYRAYPRVCGGTRDSGGSFNFPSGLSPRMRGNLALDYVGAVPVGPIPAYAGEPSRCPSIAALSTAYPRVCGGTLTAVMAVESTTGLSPRMRGNPPMRWPRSFPLGPIPAYAGEPTCPLPSFRHTRAYPRVCGGTYPPID